MALSQSNRLKLAQDFRSVFRGKQSFQESKLLLKRVPSAKPFSRFGIVVGRAVAKKAVERNRTRRLLSEALRQAPPTQAPFDVVLVALPGFSVANLQETKDIVGKLFKKAFAKGAL